MVREVLIGLLSGLVLSLIGIMWLWLRGLTEAYWVHIVPAAVAVLFWVLFIALLKELGVPVRLGRSAAAGTRGGDGSQ